MKQLLILTMVLAATALPVQASDIGVAIEIGQPGFYGRIELGNLAPPPVVYERAVIIERVRVVPAPIYLRVPPGHAKNWRKHCRKYEACGRPVYFVQEHWYEDDYVPYYHEHHGKKNKGKGKGRKDD